MMFTVKVMVADFVSLLWNEHLFVLFLSKEKNSSFIVKF